MGLFGPPDVAKMKAKRDVLGLIKALRYQKDAGVRQAAARALGELGDPRAIEPLVAQLYTEAAWEGRRTAAEALVRIHRHGGLDDGQKQLILAHGETIRCAHTDHPAYSDHDDTKHTDEEWWYDRNDTWPKHTDEPPFYSHSDRSTNRSHTDQGIGADFPL
jgi:hypothetical protein